MKGAYVAAAVSGLVAFGADAQVLSRGRMPIEVTADSSEAVENQRTVVYRGKVETFQGDNRLRADTLTARFSADWGEVVELEAAGNVFFVTPQQVIRGDRAVYTYRDDTLVVTGGVIVRQGDNVIAGERLVVQVGAGRSSMTGPSAGPGTRVRGVFYPKSKDPGSGQTPCAPGVDC